MRDHRPILLLVSVVTATACRDANPTSSVREPTITDVAGTRSVLNYEQRWRAGEEWSVSAEPFLRIGMVEGPREYLFDQVKGVSRLSDGTVVVLNAGDGQLRFYSPDGTHLRSVGGIGGGPGEIRGARWIDRLDGDVVQVTNNDGRLRFRSDGTLLSDDRLRWDKIHRISRRANLAGSAGFLMESCGLPTPLFINDSILLCSSTYTDVRFQPTAPGVHESVSLVAKSDLALETLDTIGKFARSTVIRYLAGGRLHSARIGPPYGPRSHMRVSGRPARFVHTDARSYRIEVHSIDPPRRDLIVERVGGLRAPTEIELASFERAMSGERTRNGLERRPPGDPSQFRSEVQAADSVSIISVAPFIDVLNAIWVPLEAPAEAKHRPFDVFDANGLYLGHVMLPRYGLSIHEIGEDYILGVSTDDLGVEYVVMYKLNRRTATRVASVP